MQNLKYILMVVSVLLLNGAKAQINFYKVFSSSGFDFGEGIVQMEDSSYLLTGATSSFDVPSGQAFILKTDKYGEKLWSKSYGGQESDRGRRIFINENDGIYVAGYSNSFNTGSYDFYFFKTDLNGELIYEKNYGGPKFEKLYGATKTPDGEFFIMAGSSLSNPEEVENCYMVMIDKQGTLIWEKQWGGTGRDIARSVKMLDDTTFVVIGEEFDESDQLTKAFVQRVKLDGTVLWTGHRGAVGKNYFINDFVVRQDDIIACGGVKYTSGTTEKCHPMLLRYHKDGNFLYDMVDSGLEYSRMELVQDFGTTEQYAVVEQALRSNFPIYGDGYEDNQVTLFHTYFYWLAGIFNYSRTGEDLYTEMIRTKDNGFAVVGYNSFFGTGYNNIVFIKVGPGMEVPSSTSNPDIAPLVKALSIESATTVSLFPNPSSGQFTIKCEKPLVKIEVIDLLGKKVRELDANFETTVNIAEGELEEGVYMVKIYLNDHDYALQQLMIKK